MAYRAKYLTATVVLAVAVICAVSGLGRLRGEILTGHVTWTSKALLFGGVAVGLTASVARTYWRSRLDTDDGQKLAMDALSEMGRKQLGSKTKKDDWHS